MSQVELKQNETIEQYLNYVRSQLETLSPGEAVASYDTGYGLHLVDTYLGESCHALDVRAHSILKLRSPNIDDFDTWEEAWKAGCAIVRQFTGSK